MVVVRRGVCGRRNADSESDVIFWTMRLVSKWGIVVAFADAWVLHLLIRTWIEKIEMRKLDSRTGIL